MPSHISQKKRLRQNKRNNLRNRSIKSTIKTIAKKVNRAEKAEDIKENLSKVYSVIDKAAKKNVYHRNKASRLKSKIARSVAVNKNG